MNKSSPKSNLLVAYGAEGYHLDSVLLGAKAWDDRDIRQLDGTKVSDSDILNELRSSNYEGLPVTVIVDNAEEVTESESRLLRAYLGSKSSHDLDSVLVVISRSEKLPSMWESISNGKAVNYPKLKAFGEGKSNEVIKYIKDRTVKFGFSFEDGADVIFFRATGGDLYVINNEFRKLHALASVTKETKITKKMILKFVVSNTTADPWSVAEATFNKSTKEAMRLLSHMYEDEPDKASTRICAALMKELQLEILARGMLDSGILPDGVASVLEMHPWKCKEIFLPRVRKHDLNTLVGYMPKLCGLEFDVKGAAKSKRTLVELVVLSIAS